MLAAAQWCPIVVSNVSTFFMHNGILSFTFTHLADTFIFYNFLFKVVNHDIAIDLPLRYKF